MSVIQCKESKWGVNFIKEQERERTKKKLKLFTVLKCNVFYIYIIIYSFMFLCQPLLQFLLYRDENNSWQASRPSSFIWSSRKLQLATLTWLSEYCNAVLSWNVRERSIILLERSAWTIDEWPRYVAMINGVAPLFIESLSWIALDSSKTRTISKWPL